MMDRKQVAQTLEEIGVLLELLGENPFKTRAYTNAARTLKGLDEDFQAVVEEGRLSEIKGIGPALTEKITTLATTGNLPYLEELRGKVPAGLLDWMRIRGLGARKVRAIHEALEISTLGELEYACLENRLRDLEGFGEASQKTILDGIERLRRHAGRFLQPLLLRESRNLLEVVRAAPGVQRAMVCGSVRRCGETGREIELVASCEGPEKVLSTFATGKGVKEVTASGPTRCSVRLDAGPVAHLQVVADYSFPFAALHATGSEAHVNALRTLAGETGLRLNEFAMARLEDGAGVECRDEEAIYRALGLDWITPELREDRGEIESAAGGKLPALVSRADLRGALHCHTTWSDGSAGIEEMAQECIRVGLEYIAICDHSRSAAYASGLDVDGVLEQHAEIDRLNRRFAGRFLILKGIESDILRDGSLDYPDDVLARFDLVVASVHSRFNLSREEQTERLLRAVENPYTDILGHPTGRLLLSRDPYPLDLERVLQVAAARGVAVELNAHPQRLDLDWAGLRHGLARGMKTAINPDAHAPEGIEDMEYGTAIARKGWCTADDVLNAWAPDRLREHLAERRRKAGA